MAETGTSITHRCGKYYVTLEQQPHVSQRWRATVGETFCGALTWAEGIDAAGAVTNAAKLVGEKPSDWLSVFGLT
jgi:hypothetical protein